VRNIKYILNIFITRLYNQKIQQQGPPDTAQGSVEGWRLNTQVSLAHFEVGCQRPIAMGTQCMCAIALGNK